MTTKFTGRKLEHNVHFVFRDGRTSNLAYRLQPTSVQQHHPVHCRNDTRQENIAPQTFHRVPVHEMQSSLEQAGINADSTEHQRYQSASLRAK